jgi:fimbrial chaperone protein
VRVGAKAPAQGTERAYRLFIEEVPSATATGPAAISFYFRFGVPVFVTPAGAAAQPEVQQPRLEGGRLFLDVRNPGTQTFRAARVTFTDNAGWSRDVNGWYSLPGTSRAYEAEVPREVCQKAKAFSVLLEAADGTRFDRSVNADPARCV